MPIYSDDQLSTDNGVSMSITPCDTLPVDILIDIIQEIERSDVGKSSTFRAVSCVSKNWRTAASDARTSLTLSGVKGPKFEKILARFRGLQSLNLSHLFDCSEQSLCSVARNCTRLRELIVPDSYRATDGRGLSKVARCCSWLETLEVPSFKGPSTTLDAIGENCFELRVLRLRAAQNLSDNAVKNIARNCSKIEELDLSFSKISDASLEVLGHGLKHLERLDLRQCKSVTGDGIAFVSNGCPKLQVLHLEVVDVGDAGLLSIGKHCSRLEELYLDFCPLKGSSISKDSMAALAHGCRRLRVLNLRGNKQVNDESLEGLARAGCPSLLELDMHGCDRVCDVGLQAIVNGCKELRSLVLTGTNIGSSGLASFSGGLPQLRTLKLGGDLVTNEVLMSVGENCPLLEDLLLSSTKASDMGVHAVIAGCQQLSTLTVKASADLHGTGFSCLAPALTSVSLPSCGITDEGLGSLSTNAQNMELLCLSSCNKVSPGALISLVAAAPKLKELLVGGCPQLGKDDVISLTKAGRFALRLLRVSRPGCPDDEYTLKRQSCTWTLPSWLRAVSSPSYATGGRSWS